MALVKVTPWAVAFSCKEAQVDQGLHHDPQEVRSRALRCPAARLADRIDSDTILGTKKELNSGGQASSRPQDGAGQDRIRLR